MAVAFPIYTHVERIVLESPSLTSLEYRFAILHLPSTIRVVTVDPLDIVVSLEGLGSLSCGYIFPIGESLSSDTHPVIQAASSLFHTRGNYSYGVLLSTNDDNASANSIDMSLDKLCDTCSLTLSQTKRSRIVYSSNNTIVNGKFSISPIPGSSYMPSPIADFSKGYNALVDYVHNHPLYSEDDTTDPVQNDAAQEQQEQVFLSVEATHSRIAEMISERMSVSQKLGDLGGAVLGQTLGSMIGDSATATAEADLCDDVARMIHGKLAPKISATIVPQLSKTLTDGIIRSVGSSLRKSLDTTLPDILSEELSEGLTEAMLETVPSRVAEVTSLELTRGILNTTGPLLVKSLTHSVTGALITTLSHSSLTDYFCYYCYHEKMYCQYCNYAPTQLVDALYYAGYYSSYIADYYTSHFGAELQQRVEAQADEILQSYADDDYEIVLQV